MPPTADELVALKTARSLDERALRSIFLDARTANGFLNRPVPRGVLTRAVELAFLGPTSNNTLPLRIVFVASEDAKERLAPALSAGNLEKTMAAPVTAIMAADLHFYEGFAHTHPERADALRERFTAREPAALRAFAWDNALLQMGYFIIAARSLGLDAGPMGGFDRAVVDAGFFADGRRASQYLINLGYGDDSKVVPRRPRLSIDEIARFE